MEEHNYSQEPEIRENQVNQEPKINEERVESFKEVAQNYETNEMDERLEELLASHKASIKIFGAGGGGNNTINRLTEVGVHGCETIAINTDAQDLLYASADIKILIGKETTRGLGAGSMPKLGEEAAH